VVRYKILLKAAAAREYETVASKADRRRVLSKIGALTDDPRPTESSCLPECENHRRICLMHLRVIYGIDDLHKAGYGIQNCSPSTPKLHLVVVPFRVCLT
jgi:mRNA-degrading endonuclease RelE of RelBE toxin-antitoxin system